VTDPKAIDDMTVEEREEFLVTLAESLLLSASIAKHEGDDLGLEMERLGKQLLMDAASIAADGTRKADEIVLTAINLLAKFELGNPGSRTIH